MIVICPKCGARNHLPDPPEPGKTYRCGKCKSKLTHISKTPEAKDETGLFPQVDSAGYSEQVTTSKSPTSKSSRTAELNWLKDREYLIIFLLALLILLLQLSIVPFRTSLIYDEEYYVTEARSIIYEGELTHPEHPSLGKLLIVSGISVFGDNPWGWRIPSVIFAVASVVLFYFVCRKLMGSFAALLAVFLLIFETLTFNFSGLAMLDVFSLTFMLLAFLFYLQDRYVFSGVALALGALCKMTGLLGILVILIHWIIVKRRLQSPKTIGLFVVSVSVALMLLMPLSDFAATREWLNPVDRIWYMFVAHRGLTFADLPSGVLSSQAYPWEWILDPTGFKWPDHLAYSQISLTVWILIVPSMGYMLYEYIKNKSDVSLFVLLWFGATYLLWIPLVLATDRQTYHFYFYPTVGAVCMAIGFAIRRLWEASVKGRFARHSGKTRAIIIGYLVFHVLLFLLYTPIMWAVDSYR